MHHVARICLFREIISISLSWTEWRVESGLRFGVIYECLRVGLSWVLQFIRETSLDGSLIACCPHLVPSNPFQSTLCKHPTNATPPSDCEDSKASIQFGCENRQNCR